MIVRSKLSIFTQKKIVALKNINISFQMANDGDDRDGDILIKIISDLRNQINKVPKVCYQH